MTDRMDTSVDNLTLKFESIHVSFEERHWLDKQRRLHKLDDLVKPMGDLHKTIRDCQRFSVIPTSLSASSLIPKVCFSEHRSIYYSSVVNGCTDIDLDQFRLHHQQTFHLIFPDLCTDLNYRLFIIIMEGYIFASSQTVGEYSRLFTHEMRKCLVSFDSFIRTRSSKIISLISFLSKSSLSFYTSVYTNQKIQIGVLFQLLPKVKYQLNASTVYNSILAIDEYAKHVISPEELRYVDYLMDMKSKRHLDSLQQATHPTTTPKLFTFTKPTVGRGVTLPFGVKPTQMLHSLPISYPYDDDMVYSKKYPSFWKGNNHTNEASPILFESIPLEIGTPEFTFVQRIFNQTVSESDIKIAFIERIQNSHLWEKFSSHRSYMRRKNGNENLNESWLFHGTNSDNHHQIMSHGFNRSYCHDHVLYGRGVYFSRFACYSCHYSDRQDLSFLFLCRVLAGRHTYGSNDIRIPPEIDSGDGKKIRTDSTTDHSNPYTIVCTFHDDQNYPEYIITYMTNTSTKHK